MIEKSHQNRLLLNLYLINAAANLIGSLIVGALNLLTPTEFFKLWRNYFLDDGWIYILMMYPIIVVIGSGLQYLAQRPLKLYFKPRNSKDFNQSKIFRRARRRLLMLPPTISLLNISMWTGTTEQLRGSGIVLGVDENWRYRQYDKPGLAAGQIIVLGTDGLWEALNRDGEMFGRNPVIRILNRYPGIAMVS